jgi:hypothetical protein
VRDDPDVPDVLLVVHQFLDFLCLLESGHTKSTF